MRKPFGTEMMRIMRKKNHKCNIVGPHNPHDIILSMPILYDFFAVCTFYTNTLITAYPHWLHMVADLSSRILPGSAEDTACDASTANFRELEQTILTSHPAPPRHLPIITFSRPRETFFCHIGNYSYFCTRF